MNLDYPYLHFEPVYDSEFLCHDAATYWNGDTTYNLECVMKSLRYTDMKEAVNKYCHNTPRDFLKKGRINECDLCKLLAHATDQDKAKDFEEFLTKKVLKRPLKRKPLHADREELGRQVAEDRRRIEESGRDPYPWELPLSGDEEVKQPDVWGYFYPDDGGEPELVKVSLYNGY